MIHVDNGCDVDNDSGKLDTSQDFPGNRPWDGQGSDSDSPPSEGIIIVTYCLHWQHRQMSCLLDHVQLASVAVDDGLQL